jgi:hypothetical protein
MPPLDKQRIEQVWGILIRHPWPVGLELHHHLTLAALDRTGVHLQAAILTMGHAFNKVLHHVG